MPAAAAKVEKVVEGLDPYKYMHSLVDKKIRNVEKRVAKLDHYKLEVENGKELNEDQKTAVSKYDQVVDFLEYVRELQKSFLAVQAEYTRGAKKQAKKEQLERQQHEIQRLQESFLYCHFLKCFQNEDVRSDFLNGENGAVQLASEQLSQLDQLHKIIGPELPSEQADIHNHFHTKAENYIFLAEGKNKEIAGTTYKVLKDLLQTIKDCGYFSRPSGPVEEDAVSSDDLPDDEAISEKTELNQENLPEVESEEGHPQDDNAVFVQDQCEIQESEAPIDVPVEEEIVCSEVPQLQNGPLQEVLSGQGTFNFLQESQIDLDAPHMDPAVVAVHQMAPPPAVNFAGSTYPASAPIEDKLIVNGPENGESPSQPSPVSQVPIVPVTVPRTVAPVLSSVQLNSQHEFDPSHPIPTQTFTNQSFAVMQNMIMPQGYVPVTMHHAPMAPHVAPIAVVPGLSPPVTTGTSVVPVHVPVTPVSVAPVADNTPNETEPKNNDEEDEQKLCDEDSPAAESETTNTGEKNGENGYTNSYRGGSGYRRGRARGNGYFRGRPNYNGRGGGNFQNHYYQDRNGYNGNYRRGNNRGAPRGNGNNRGRGNYRTQGSSAQQQQQQQQTQQ